MLRMLLIAMLAACGGKPAAQAPSNTATGSVAPPTAAPTDDLCGAQKSCAACLSSASPDPEKGSCQWDTGKQTCQVACDPSTRNCVLVGARTLKPADVAEVCANAKPVAP